MFSPLSPADKGFTPRSDAQLLEDFLTKSDAGAPGAPSVNEITRKHRKWSALGKQAASPGTKLTVKFD